MHFFWKLAIFIWGKGLNNNNLNNIFFKTSLIHGQNLVLAKKCPHTQILYNLF